MKIKVLSLNLWHGKFISRSIEFLGNQDADIVLLQEVHGGQDLDLPDRLRSFELIRKRLQYPYDDFAPVAIFNNPEGKTPNGLAILSKFSIISREVTFFQEPFSEDYEDIPENFSSCPRALQYVVLDTPAGKLNVFNFHGAWDLEGDSYSERRRRMSQIIVEATKGKPNVILGGDTNAKPANQAIKNIEKHLTSVFGHDLQTTFNMRHKDNPGYATSAVDMLFVSPNIEILSRECPDVDVSDHLPVMATLQMS